jgi:hypothetical protein
MAPSTSTVNSGYVLSKNIFGSLSLKYPFSLLSTFIFCSGIGGLKPPPLGSSFSISSLRNEGLSNRLPRRSGREVEMLKWQELYLRLGRLVNENVAWKKFQIVSIIMIKK